MEGSQESRQELHTVIYTDTETQTHINDTEKPQQDVQMTDTNRHTEIQIDTQTNRQRDKQTD